MFLSKEGGRLEDDGGQQQRCGGRQLKTEMDDEEVVVASMVDDEMKMNLGKQNNFHDIIGPSVAGKIEISNKKSQFKPTIDDIKPRLRDLSFFLALELGFDGC
ncbi:unnamed protein product [Lactuca virosa]|uniref:Uncharacterized protein n=1 Tax=Lactuca virosa TaxID=75947 RepID=A0AAU9PT18_9ASTR|nr:unnamed protein product [Lactuca virosa]